MIRVLLYSVLLVSGMGVTQFFDVSRYHAVISLATMSCLSYIMIEVGLEFFIDKKRLRSYGWDYAVAATAASFPWIFCATYFVAVFGTEWREALLIGRFAAPTSAGVLFTLLAAAGLGTTWIFKKARVLAIFDDLDTVLFLIPLQVLFVGWKMELGIVLIVILLLLMAAYQWMHQLRWPINKKWLLGYGIVIAIASSALGHFAHLHLEVLLPAFVLGCLLYEKRAQMEDDPHSLLDQCVKAVFLFLVGCSLPRISLEGMNWTLAAVHVAALTLLSNLGKCFPALCYRKEAHLKERLALSVAMFPRGEVGAGVLLVALGYGLKGLPVTLAGMSLALNLFLTGGFIFVVIKLLQSAQRSRSSS